MKSGLNTVSVHEAVAALLSGPITKPRRRGISKSAVCLIGAGCSVTAGLPTADAIADIIWHTEPNIERTQGTGYGELMRALPAARRYQVFQRWVCTCRLNRAHIGLGYLVRRGVVGRILTTNFDDLILRGCSLYGECPAVHDLGSLAMLAKKGVQGYKKTYDIQEPTVLFLHGRYNGFWQIHDRKDSKPQAEQLHAILNQYKHRPWIVVGYSGENDDLRDQLKGVVAASSGFYWVNLSPPSAAVTSALGLDTGRSGYFVQCGADEFFGAMAQALSRSARGDGWLRAPMNAVHESLVASRAIKPRKRARHSGRGMDRNAKRASRASVDVTLQRVRNEIVDGREGSAHARLQKAAAVDIVRGERLLAAQPPRANEALKRFDSALRLLDPESKAHACTDLLSMGRGASAALDVEVRLHRLVLWSSGLFARAALGYARSHVAADAPEQTLKRLRAGIRAVRNCDREPALILALGVIDCARATRAERRGRGMAIMAKAGLREIDAALLLAPTHDVADRRRVRSGIRAAHNAIHAHDASRFRIASERAIAAAITVITPVFAPA